MSREGGIMKEKKKLSLAMQIFIALVAGVDRIFDMGRTTVNITGDAACTMVVSHLEEKKLAKAKD
jgi:hypothetical protein